MAKKSPKGSAVAKTPSVASPSANAVPSTPTKKPRKKKQQQPKTAKSPTPSSTGFGSSAPSSSTSPFAITPIYDLLHNFEKAPDQWAARYILILTAIILRSAVGLGSFSGESQLPINGDFEAQRHWMELTIHLPIDKWYFYDLPYWGLDYPPLTAFHSYICGRIGSFINASWFALDASRGVESTGLKTFMRMSALLSELIVYFPALVGFIAFIGKKLNLPRMDQMVVSAMVMCQPALVLIDHGHFQYNSVMLGLFVFALTDLCKGNFLLASVWFVSCICFKQMGLYYAPFIFAYLLSKCFTNQYDIGPGGAGRYPFVAVAKSLDIKRLASLGITVILTFIAILSPFYYFSSSSSDLKSVLTQILVRVFPFQRGIFEDKVANFWCTTNLVIKYRTLFSQPQLTRISLLLTLVSIVPPCAMIVYKNLFARNFSKASRAVSPHSALLYGFAATAWGFYMFSFQVHEKTVLIPLLPSTLLYILGTLDDANSIAIIQWVNNIAVFSMWPLLKRDGLVLQYMVTIFLSNFFIYHVILPRESSGTRSRSISALAWKIVIVASYIAASAIHAIEYFYSPPANYPDLWVILNTTLSFGCFGLFWLWILYRMYQL